MVCRVDLLLQEYLVCPRKCHKAGLKIDIYIKYLFHISCKLTRSNKYEQQAFSVIFLTWNICCTLSVADDEIWENSAMKDFMRNTAKRTSSMRNTAQPITKQNKTNQSWLD